jgi:type IV pilus assembly protein PilC
MLFRYRAIDKDGRERGGTIEALSKEVAISALQRRGLIISAIDEAGGKSLLNFNIPFFGRVKNKDIVILSRQVATLFEAQVPALRIVRLLAAEVENRQLATILTQVADDIQGGSPISKALSSHPKAFSSFFVNMVKAGEESGRLSETFNYLADYLDRSYELLSKATHALIYPAFVIVVFFSVMGLMLTLVIPKISAVLIDSGQEMPFFTKIILALSTFLVQYGIFILIGLVLLGLYVYQMGRTEKGRFILDEVRLAVPYIGTLYKRLYYARIADNFATMLLAGVSVIEALEITSVVVGNSVYEKILSIVSTDVKGGLSISEAFGRHPEMPSIIVAMIRVGEETGELGKILSTLAKFYNREVSNAVDTLVDLIEPLMIVLLGLGVGILLAAVLIPIYNLTGAV